MTIRRQVIVDGVVQGVGFRYRTREEARRLGVTGWVRNRPDGSVEAEIEGAERAVASMLEWLEHGPRGASVSAVKIEEISARDSPGFEITG